LNSFVYTPFGTFSISDTSVLSIVPQPWCPLLPYLRNTPKAGPELTLLSPP
jgi:hypothetical protein